MKTREIIGPVAIILFLGIVGALLIQPKLVEAQSEKIRIQRYEFPQDGVVCYRPSFYQTNAPFSCVKIR